MMKAKVVEWYRAFRSIRTSTWVLLAIAVGSTMLYFQVRPDPIVSNTQPPGVPVTTTTVPATTSTTRPKDSVPQASTTSAVPGGDDDTTTPSVSTEITTSTLGNDADTSSSVPVETARPDGTSTTVVNGGTVSTTTTSRPGGSGAGDKP